MPDVTVRCRTIRDWTVSEFQRRLPVIVAENLSVPGSRESELTAAEVEISFHPYGPHDVHGKYILEIIIDVNYYRARARTIDQRAKMIKEAIAELPAIKALNLKDDEWFVWVRLHKASFR